MAFVAVIGVSDAFEVFLVHPDWKLATLHTLLPSLDRSSPQYSHDSRCTPPSPCSAPPSCPTSSICTRRWSSRVSKNSTGSALPATETLEGLAARNRRTELPRRAILSRFLSYELIDVFVAMNGAWLINSAMILMAAVAFVHTANLQPTMSREAYLEPSARSLAAPPPSSSPSLCSCSGLSSTVGVMAGQVIIEGFLAIRFPIFLRRLITVIPAIVIIATGLDPLKILVLSQVVLSFALPFALVPLLLLTNREDVMHSFRSAPSTRIAGWLTVAVILTLNAVLLGQLAFGS